MALDKLASEPSSPRIQLGTEFEDFANALDVCLSREGDRRQHILDLPRRFHEITLRKLAQLRPSVLRDGQDDVDMDADDVETTMTSASDRDEIKRLEKEVQTWDLLRRLLPLRYTNVKPETKPTPTSFSTDRPAKAIIEDFWQSDSIALERRAVLQWLQNTASSGPPIDDMVQELQQNADRGDIIAYGWLHTRAAIKLRKSVTAWPHLLDRQSSSISESHINADGAPMVTQLDPDAVTRQGKKLEPQDDYFERAIWLGCFEHLRRGSSLKVLREWCQERTEMWRAVSMSAVLLSADDKESVADTNPTSLSLWRRMCYSLSRQGGCDDYERAVYGVLSGDIQSVEKVALTWDDHLFANYNALLRTQLDNFLLASCPPDAASNLTQTFACFDALQFHGNADQAEKHIIRSLETNKRVQKEALEPHKALQAAFLSKDIDHYLYEQGLVITGANKATGAGRALFGASAEVAPLNREKFFPKSQFDGMRIVAHTYLLLALLNRVDGQEQHPLHTRSDRKYAQESILAGYTELLQESQMNHAIPLYCSILDPPRCYEVLSKSVLAPSTDKEPENDRPLQLRLINKAGIDVIKFVRHQASRVYMERVERSGFPPETEFRIFIEGPPSPRYGRLIKPDFFGPDEDDVAPEHSQMIASLEWLLMTNETWPDVFTAGANLYKYFLKNMHLVAARALLKRVSYETVLAHLPLEEGFVEGWENDVGFWAHLLGDAGQPAANAPKVMGDARIFRQLQSLVKALDGLETIASMVNISAELQPTNRSFWTELGNTLGATKDSVQGLLRGWLLSEIEEGDMELARLREAFLPETMLAYVSALHFAGARLSRDNLLECMELASVVAEPNSDLADSFVKAGRMKELVEALAAVSKALAVSTGDKKSSSSSSKKLREMGWSREIWSVKP
ncbi:nuclear pore protein 84/107 [Stachybotrys elegans]|uniref:Nuclear pore complex protein n=1 Tax=Stachybotrys elegans TaxID=80388 RepID=A0A8K0WXA8_9HYPO|nr:nuclear pore protein 84/107 [Stachybotrys elegans]